MRKVFSNQKKLEEGKVASFVLDGNNLPFTSRMKPVLKKNHDKMKGKLQASSSSNDLAVPAKRQKSNTGISVLQHSSSPFAPFPNSSEDEIQLTKTILRTDVNNETILPHFEHPERLAEDPSLWYLRFSYPLNLEPMLAEEPSGIWPPTCEVPRRTLVKWQ